MATNGFATDPLVADTDDDGALDGADPSPLDGDSQQAPPAGDEPAVSVSSQVVTLTADAQAATGRLARGRRPGGYARLSALLSAGSARRVFSR